MTAKKETQQLNLKLDAIEEHLTKIEENMQLHKNTMEQKISNLMTELETIKNSNSFLSDRYDQLQEISSANKKAVDDIKSENLSLKETVIELKSIVENAEKSLNNLEQYSRRECIEINGIPSTPEESTDDIVVALAKQIGVTITPNDISISHRLKKSTTSQHPPTIIAKFTSRKIRNKIFENRLKLKQANTGKMIFVNESLTTTNREIFKACRNFKKVNNWKYVWTKQGQTYLKKSDNDNTWKIESISDLTKYEISTSAGTV